MRGIFAQIKKRSYKAIKAHILATFAVIVNTFLP